MLSEAWRPRSGGQDESKHLAFHCMRRNVWFYVYIMQSSSRRALYIGVTSKLEKRVFEHKTGAFGGFSDKYRAHRLVYFERYSDIRSAIDREKQLKGWRRAKKIALIESLNPGWKDLSEGWFETQGPSTRVTAGSAATLAQDDIAKKDASP